jgi:ATP-dependent protease ClpP protease subunit
MRILLCAVLGALLTTVGVVLWNSPLRSKLPLSPRLSEIVEQLPSALEKLDLPTPDLSLKDKKSEPKPRKVKKIITLEDKNMVVFRGPVTDNSVSRLMLKIQRRSNSLSASTPIFLVIDSPGGSVFAGLNFIDFLEALPQKIHTVTLFAASMAFQIVQNQNTRYVLRQGTLMSHRARLSKLSGQMDGELESRYKMIKRKIDYLDVVAADRMGMALDEYKRMIKDEYWVHGFDAVGDQAADEMVLLRCGKSLSGVERVTYRTMFGPVVATFSKCPLIRTPLSTRVRKVQKEHRAYVRRTFNLLFNDRTRFVQEYILGDRFGKVFGR